jgi:hypothetical protein
VNVAHGVNVSLCDDVDELLPGDGGVEAACDADSGSAMDDGDVCAVEKYYDAAMQVGERLVAYAVSRREQAVHAAQQRERVVPAARVEQRAALEIEQGGRLYVALETREWLEAAARWRLEQPAVLPHHLRSLA